MKSPRYRTKAAAVFVLCALVVWQVGAQKLPSPTGFVNDFAGIIDARDEAAITKTAEAIQRATSIEVAVATVETFAPYGSVEEFSIDLATQWGVGSSADDNGMLIVVALNERKTRIEVGYGLEGVFPDGMVGRIMDTSMVPYFKNNDFGTGLVKAVEGIAGVISEEYDVDLAGVSSAESEKYTSSSRGSVINPMRIIWFVVLLFAGGGRLLWPMLLLGGMGRRGRHYRGGFGVGSRGGFGGRSGGGFGGFGGGSFGGGGGSRGF